MLELAIFMHNLREIDKHLEDCLVYGTGTLEHDGVIMTRVRPSETILEETNK